VSEMPGVPDDAAGLRAANARLRELLAERDERIAVQDAEIAVLRDAKGQPGVTMELTDYPDKRVRHRPAKCGCCGKSLKGADVTAVERRQVIDIPRVRAKTTEHQMLTLLCGCGCETKADAPDGVTAPVQYGPRLMGTGIYLWYGQFLSRDRACQALAEMFGCAPSPGALAHFDETGFRTAGKLAWVHSASWDKYVLVTVHAKRGKDGMKAAGVLPFFTGIAVHDAWKPYDTFENVAGHALCGAHVLRELVAVTETGTDLDKAWARQAIDPEILEKHEDWYRKAAATGIALNTGRHGKLQQKRHALAKRMQDRGDDYLRYARDLRVPFTNEGASYCTSWVRSAVSGFLRWSARCVNSVAWGNDILGQRAAEAGVVAAA
jgi:transposase